MLLPCAGHSPLVSIGPPEISEPPMWGGMLARNRSMFLRAWSRICFSSSRCSSAFRFACCCCRASSSARSLIWLSNSRTSALFSSHPTLRYRSRHSRGSSANRRHVREARDALKSERAGKYERTWSDSSEGRICTKSRWRIGTSRSTSEAMWEVGSVRTSL